MNQAKYEMRLCRALGTKVYRERMEDKAAALAGDSLSLQQRRNFKISVMASELVLLNASLAETMRKIIETGFEDYESAVDRVGMVTKMRTLARDAEAMMEAARLSPSPSVSENTTYPENQDAAIADNNGRQTLSKAG